MRLVDWEPRMNSRLIRELEGLQFCWATGLTRPPYGWGGPWFLQIAHLGAGSGSMRRVDDIRAVVLLCPLAHELHSVRQGTKRINGVEYPRLTNENVLFIKKWFDPDNYDSGFIEKHWRGRVPCPTAPHEWFRQQLLDNAGVRLGGC